MADVGPEVERLVSVNEFAKAFTEAKIPIHTVCGSECGWESNPTESGLDFGVFCMRCMRRLMVGEVAWRK